MAAIIMGVFFIGLLVLVGCTKIEKVYVCVNGQEVPDNKLCPTNKIAGVKKADAENYANRYVSAFFAPYGGKAQLVSSYLNPDQGDYMATFIVSEKGGLPYETVVSIDGVTGKVNCTEKCEYS